MLANYCSRLGHTSSRLQCPPRLRCHRRRERAASRARAHCAKPHSGQSAFIERCALSRLQSVSINASLFIHPLTCHDTKHPSLLLPGFWRVLLLVDSDSGVVSTGVLLRNLVLRGDGDGDRDGDRRLTGAHCFCLPLGWPFDRPPAPALLPGLPRPRPRPRRRRRTCARQSRPPR